MLKLLSKSWFVILSAVVLALLFPQLSGTIEPFLTLLLILLMSFSTKNIELKSMASLRMLKKAFLLFLADYALLSGLIIAVSFFVPDIYAPGFIIMAAVPCAISVIPFTKLLSGDTAASTLGLILSYLLSFVITPGIIFIFYRESIDTFQLLKTIFLLVAVPLLLSRILKKFNNAFKKYDNLILNIIFFVAFYGFISLNRNTIVNEFFTLQEVVAGLILRTIVIVLAVYYFMRKKGKFGISVTVFSGFKNLGYAALLSLTLFGREASLVPTLGLVFETFTFIILDRIIPTSESHT